MINICKFYKHEKGCSCPYDCVQQLSTDCSVCVSDLYYAMGLKQERDCYLDALNKISKLIICEKQGYFTSLELKILKIIDECTLNISQEKL